MGKKKKSEAAKKRSKLKYRKNRSKPTETKMAELEKEMLQKQQHVKWEKRVVIAHSKVYDSAEAIRAEFAGVDSELRPKTVESALKFDMIGLHDKVPLPLDEADRDIEYMTRYKIYEPQRICTRGWQVVEGFERDKVTEVYMEAESLRVLTLQDRYRLMAWLLSKAATAAAGEIRLEDVTVAKQLGRALYRGNRAPLFTVRGQAMQSAGIDPDRQLGMVQQAGKILEVDIGTRRHHAGVGTVVEPGVRYRYQEGQHSGVSKTKASAVQKDCTPEQERGFYAQLQPITNAVLKGVSPWMRKKLKHLRRKLKAAWSGPGTASLCYAKISVGFNYGAGFHLDPHDEGEAVWGVMGPVEIAFPGAQTVVRLRSGDVIEFDARIHYHACVAIGPRTKNAVLSFWNSQVQLTKLAEASKRISEAKAEQEEHHRWHGDQCELRRLAKVRARKRHAGEHVDDFLNEEEDAAAATAMQGTHQEQEASEDSQEEEAGPSCGQKRKRAAEPDSQVVEQLSEYELQNQDRRNANAARIAILEAEWEKARRDHYER